MDTPTISDREDRNRHRIREPRTRRRWLQEATTQQNRTQLRGAVEQRDSTEQPDSARQETAVLPASGRDPVTASAVRYIKLGSRNRDWETTSLAEGELHFGYGRATHELALKGDGAAIKQHLVSLGRNPKAAARDAQEVLDFYQLGADCLWITFAHDHLWWTFADPEVRWIGAPTHHRGERMRRTIGGWRNTDILGRPLRIDGLSTKLTKVGSYRRTICQVESEAYLLRRINGIDDPLVARSVHATNTMLDVLSDAIAALHWRDFETLTDIAFARSGWHRASALGGTQKLTDIVLEQPATGDLAAIQVKSAAGQEQFDQFIIDADASGRFRALFFVCHTPRGRLQLPDRPDVHLWVGRDLAKIVLRVGLMDWVMDKIA